MYYMSADAHYTRPQFITLWEKVYPQQKDVIIKIKTGFILKTDNDNVTETL